MFSKLRVSRGPLRWWIVVLGLSFGRFEPPPFGIGLSLVVLGTVLHIVAKGALWQNRYLSMDGPYRFVRHPFYVANLLIDTGLMLVIGRWEVAAPVAIVWAYVYSRTIASEEATLVKLFGDEYATYRRRVPRFLPNPWRYLRREEVRGRRFSWTNPNLVTGAEWTRACGILACPWLLAAASDMRSHMVSPQAGGLEFAAAALAVASALFVAGSVLSLRRRRRLATPVEHSVSATA